nr:MAG TPA: hypothetical protein [Caudoviricetes sp.]
MPLLKQAMFLLARSPAEMKPAIVVMDMFVLP